MPNRRDFVKTAATAAAGLLVAGRNGGAVQPPPAAPVKRRTVTIGGRRVKVIDVHCHAVVPEVAEVVKGTKFVANAGGGGRGGGRGGAGGGGGSVLGPARLEIMDEQGIDIQALSINGFWWYAADRDLARDIVKLQNEKLAAWC